jgi:hypothetical protein
MRKHQAGLQHIQLQELESLLGGGCSLGNEREFDTLRFPVGSL